MKKRINLKESECGLWVDLGTGKGRDNIAIIL